MIFCVFIFIFCLEPTVREQLDEDDFRHYHDNFFESTILELDDYSYVQSSFPKITIHFDNGSWKTPYTWRFYRYGSSQVLIHSWVNIFKQTSTKMPEKLSFLQKPEPDLRKTLLADISLIIVYFFFAQINLLFKCNLVFIWYFSLQFICLFLIVCDLGVHSEPPWFSLKTKKKLIKLNFVVFF